MVSIFSMGVLGVLGRTKDEMEQNTDFEGVGFLSALAVFSSDEALFVVTVSIITSIIHWNNFKKHTFTYGALRAGVRGPAQFDVAWSIWASKLHGSKHFREQQYATMQWNFNPMNPFNEWWMWLPITYIYISIQTTPTIRGTAHFPFNMTVLDCLVTKSSKLRSYQLVIYFAYH